MQKHYYFQAWAQRPFSHGPPRNSASHGRKPHRTDCNRSTQTQSQLYPGYAYAFDTAGIVKMFIGVHDTVGASYRALLAFGPVRRLLNVATVDVPLDLSWYAAWPELAQAQLQLEVVHAACPAVSAAWGGHSRGGCPNASAPIWPTPGCCRWGGALRDSLTAAGRPRPARATFWPGVRRPAAWPIWTLSSVHFY